MNTTAPSDTASRVGAIDLLRALTMVLMIFVNDLWSLSGIPAWLEHVESGVDGMGLADTVFPAFLFIVGMSLPFAVDARRSKGDSDLKLIGHVVGRSVALLVMGVFLVNGETINAASGMGHLTWNVVSCLCFILIWNAWPKSMPVWVSRGLQGVGVAVLLGLAFVYRGGADGQLERFAPQWWGILGLIGWSYLAAGLVAVLAHGRLWALIAGWVGLSVLSVVWAAGLVPEVPHVIPEPVIGGTLAGLTMGGVVVGRLFQIYRARGDNRGMTIVFVVIAVALIGLSAVTRPYWGLSKLAATPAWLFACSALTLGAFVALYWISDVWGKARWFSLVKPAGTDTLLCYLMPYFLYAAFVALHLGLPAVLLSGGVGLVKSLLFALLCVGIAGLLSRVGVRLKL